MTPAPRLAETADGLWAALRSLARSGIPDPTYGGVDYPVLLVPGLGHFSLDVAGRFDCTNVGEGGMGARAATQEEIAQLHSAIDQDQALIITLAPAGFRSDYGRRRTRHVLHQPRGHWPATC